MKYPTVVIALSVFAISGFTVSAQAQPVKFLLVPVGQAPSPVNLGIEHASNSLAIYTNGCSLTVNAAGQEVLAPDFNGAAFGTMINIGHGSSAARGEASTTLYVMGDGLRHGARLTGFTLLDGGRPCTENVMGVKYTFRKYQASVCTDCGPQPEHRPQPDMQQALPAPAR